VGRLFQITLLALAAMLLTACATDTIEDRRYGQQVVCHDGKKTLSLSNASAHDHMQHGDPPGPCPDED
jgi:outer membrane biogenesis lipoprotein LolB